MIAVMTPEAVANYGEQWRHVQLEVTHTSYHHMPAKEFYAKGQPEGYHPGYDKSMGGRPLYDFKRADTGEPVPFSLYGYEVRIISR